MTRAPVLERGEVVVRPLRRADEREWLALRAENRAWLRPWEASIPGARARSVTFASYVRGERRAHRKRTGIPMVIEVDGALVGRVALARVEWGAEQGGSIGYWVSHSVAGRGIAPTAVALLTEHAFMAGLHRIEIAVRPENAASLRVVQKLHFREEGVRRSYLFIDGAWRDHRIFALTDAEPRVGPFWYGGS
jgi:ribosomal-protein-alanine N-acetyltransferase